MYIRDYIVNVYYIESVDKAKESNNDRRQPDNRKSRKVRRPPPKPPENVDREKGWFI